MNVVLYLRYSSDKQTEQSIEGQQRICEQYCRQNDLTVTNIYIDRALSASKDVEKRTNFQKMIKDSEKGNFQAVVVYKLDRFSRSRYDSATYKYKLKRNGVRVISATENISNSPEGIILESVLEGMAEFYSLELAQKVTRGMNETALKANSCGGKIPLGYKVENKKFVINEETAPIVREAFKRYAAGETVSTIVDDFNARGLRTDKGGLFNKNSFRNMFKNIRYIGTYKYGDIKIENGMPAIIDKKLFDTVQKRIELKEQGPKKTRATVDYLLSQKIFCGHCGSLMGGEYGTGKCGKQYFYYNCLNKKQNHSCDKKNAPKEWIERKVVENTVNLLTDADIERFAEIAVQQAKQDAQHNENFNNAKRELENTEKSIANLLTLVERGSQSEQLFARLQELEQIKKTNIKNFALAKTEIIQLDKEQIVHFLEKFTQGDINDETYRKRIIDMFVNSVTVWDEPDGYFKITIAFNLTSIKSKPFRCSNNDTNGPPDKDTV